MNSHSLSTSSMGAYTELVERSIELTRINELGNLISWDQEVYMPPGGAGARAEIVAYVSKLYHSKLTEPRFGELLEVAAAGDRSPEEAANLREWQREYEKACKLPDEFVARAARLYSEAFDVWQKAKRENKYALFAAKLAQVVRTVQEEAHYLGGNMEPYDALLDKFEPGLTTAQCAGLFSRMKECLIPVLRKIQKAAKKPDGTLFGDKHFDIEKQRVFNKQVTAALGFDYNAGRLDVSEHPFTNRIGVGDVRITTALLELDPMNTLFHTVHEAGHGIYEQGLPVMYQGTPMGNAISTSIHESQSRFYENHIARSRPFWEFWFPKFKEMFAAETAGIGFNEFYRYINRVEPSMIRITADELTYHFHIIIRFEIERDLVSGSLDVAVLPEVWRQKYKEYLGLDVSDDVSGVLQDVHWSWGSFGYFPVYSFGSTYAAQLDAAMHDDISSLDESIRMGNFSIPLTWLREHIHKIGSLYTPDDLIRKATGRPIDASYLTDYLIKKYGMIYEF